MPELGSICYFHGLDSSEGSAKAVQCGHYLAQQPDAPHYRIPRLAYDPKRAHQQISTLLATCTPPIGLMGSSMGGYYAAWASQQLGLPAVLINPVPAPHHLLGEHLGARTNPHTGEQYTFDADDVAYLSQQVISVSHPERLQVWLETDDEVLDYRLAAEFYRDCDVRILQGGNHAFVNFEQCLPEMLGFLQNQCSLSG